MTHVSSPIPIGVLFADSFNQPLNFLFFLAINYGDKILSNIVSITCLFSHQRSLVLQLIGLGSLSYNLAMKLAPSRSVTSKDLMLTLPQLSLLMPKVFLLLKQFSIFLHMGIDLFKIKSPFIFNLLKQMEVLSLILHYWFLVSFLNFLVKWLLVRSYHLLKLRVYFLSSLPLQTDKLTLLCYTALYKCFLLLFVPLLCIFFLLYTIKFFHLLLLNSPCELLQALSLPLSHFIYKLLSHFRLLNLSLSMAGYQYTDLLIPLLARLIQIAIRIHSFSN